MEADSPLFLSANTIEELRRGVDLTATAGPQAEALEAWLAQLLQDDGDRLLALDRARSS